jgi:outer membrane lipoprotein-sorting protein
MRQQFVPASAVLCLALFAAAPIRPAGAENKATPAFTEFVKAFADVSDFQERILTHETSDDGKDVQDRTYDYRWKRPNFARITIIDGPGKGGVASWQGGDKVSGHQGGILAMIHLTLDIHDKRATSQRGDTLDTASFAWQVAHFQNTPGTLSEAAGPTLDGHASTAVTLAVSDPKSNGNVSRDVLDISNATHLPLRRQQFVGAQLVKSETFMDVKLNNGFTAGDF